MFSNKDKDYQSLGSLCKDDDDANENVKYYFPVIVAKSFGMESVYQHSRNKIGMNCGIKCFVMFSRPLHNLTFSQFTWSSGRRRQK